MKFPRLLSSALQFVGALALLSGCGGGGGGGTSVQNLTATNVRYGGAMIITVSGRGLDQGIELTVDGPCINVTAIGTITDTTAQYTCAVAGVGRLTPRVREAGGDELASVRVDVPLPRVSMTVTDGTRSGSVVVELDPVAAPRTVGQFMAYVSSGFYKDTVFHRVRPDAAILGGGFVSEADGVYSVKLTTRNPIAMEATGLKNVRGALAMFREGDRDSANSMFLINTVDNPRFDAGSTETPEGYAVFGRVVQGLDIVDIVAAVPVRPDLNLNVLDVPVTPVKISAIAQTR